MTANIREEDTPVRSDSSHESSNSGLRDEALHVMLLALINAAGYGNIDGWFAIRARELVAEMEKRGMA